MSIGTWLLTATGGAVGTAAACEATGRLPRVRATAEGVAGVLGPVLATYTAVLVADTAAPVWHEAAASSRSSSPPGLPPAPERPCRSARQTPTRGWPAGWAWGRSCLRLG